MPKPRKDEKKSDYMSRCMADAAMREKYPKQAQRYVVCNAIYKTEKPK
jgi:hypothetical protein